MNNGNPHYYISSADLLSRNLDRRVEVMLDISTKECQKTLGWILETLLIDDYNSYILDKDGKWKKPQSEKYNAHNHFIEHSIDKKPIKK